MSKELSQRESLLVLERLEAERRLSEAYDRNRRLAHDRDVYMQANDKLQDRLTAAEDAAEMANAAYARLEMRVAVLTALEGKAVANMIEAQRRVHELEEAVRALQRSTGVKPCAG